MQQEIRRYTGAARSTAYALMSAAGVLYIVQPAASIVEALGPTARVWALFIAVGAAACAMSYTRIIFQYIGLPLLWAAFLTLGVSFFTENRDGIPRPAGFLYLSLGTLFFLQWLHIRRIVRLPAKRAAVDANRHSDLRCTRHRRGAQGGEQRCRMTGPVSTS